MKKTFVKFEIPLKIKWCHWKRSKQHYFHETPIFQDFEPHRKIYIFFQFHVLPRFDISIGYLLQQFEVSSSGNNIADKDRAQESDLTLNIWIQRCLNSSRIAIKTFPFFILRNFSQSPMNSTSVPPSVIFSTFISQKYLSMGWHNLDFEIRVS